MLRRVEDRPDLFPFTAPDNVAGSRAATLHLIDQGARRIAFVGGLDGRAVTEERKAGYLAVLQENGIDPLVLTGRSSRAFGREVAKSLQQDLPDVDAAVCFNDLVALGMLSGCHETGRSVGHDFRIVGFDDIEEVAQCFPALSSVRCDIADIGEQAAKTIVAWLEKNKTPAPETRTPVSLSVRGSSGPHT
jgi:LacI family transcriptional regulator